jgi:large subunit ribosomal protein L22
MEVRATAKYMRISAQKTRLVARNISGKTVEEANTGLDVDNLIVKRVMINEGPTSKRIQPRAMGRAYRIFKRTSHVTVIVDEL